MSLPPSTYTPFSRRFTNERERELAEVRELYAWVKARQDAFQETVQSIGTRTYETIPYLDRVVDEPLVNAMCWLLEGEQYLFPLEPPQFNRMSMKEFVDYRNVLYAKQYFFANQEGFLGILYEGLERIFANLGELLPDVETPSPFTIPLVYALHQPAYTIEQIYGTLVDQKYESRGIFKTEATILYKNLCHVSGREPGVDSKKPWKNVSDSTLPLNEMVQTYLGGSVFEPLFKTPVPLKLTHEERFNHTHIVGGTGAGKTSLIENLIIHDIATDNPPSMVLIDPHGDLIRRLTHADLGIEDRLVIIDPRDIEHPPALNIFALNQERMGKYDATTREQVTAGVIQTFDYLFSGLFGMDLTGKQQVLFRNVARLMLSLPETMGRNATILDMMKLMSDATPYLPAIEALPEIPRDFFLEDFRSNTFKQTKEQIRYRLQAILENPTLARLFTSPETKVDIFTELNQGSIILVDTAKDFLKDGSSIFGRIFISLVLQAVLERASIAAENRKDTFLIVDEAASYFDSNIDDLLTETRKYRCGCVFAHQYLDQASSSLRASLAANTGTKFASGLSAGDARAMASDMRTTPDFILGQPRLQFATHIRNVTPHAVSIPIAPGALQAQPQLSEAAYAALMEKNRERVSLTTQTAPTAPVEAASAISEDVSPPPGGKGWDEW